MIYNAAPILGPLRDSGGTYISFSSTNNDISLTSLNEHIHMVPSKFVALKLPEWNNQLNVQHLWHDPSEYGNPFTTNPNTLLPKTFQNYLENALQYSYQFRNDPNSFKNPAEQLFWKMIRNLEGFELIDTGDTVTIEGQPYSIFEEDDTFAPNYEDVVKYVGDLNVLNFVKKGGQAYTEIYAHIPTHGGLTENIKFIPGLIDYTQSDIPNAGEAGDETLGLEDFDNDNNLAIFDNALDKVYNVNDDKNQAILWFDNLELDPETNYNNGDFDFNAILVYYDIWDDRDLSTKTRNLHGILFVDNFEDVGSSSWGLKLFSKHQPDVGVPGNAFGFRINLKFANSTNPVDSEITINDYSTVSMDLYMEALKRLNSVTDLYLTLDQQVKDMQAKINSLYQYMPRLTELDNYEDRVSLLEKQVYATTQVERISNEDLFELFQKTSTQLEESDTPVQIQQIVGMIQFDENQNPIIQSPNGQIWEWDDGNGEWLEVIT